MTRGYERIASAIEIKLKHLEEALIKEKEYLQKLPEEAHDSYGAGISTATITRLESEIDYLDMIVGELRYG